MNLVTEGERFVTDTHALIWHIGSSPRLSTEARRRFLMADRGEAIIFVSVMTLIEILYLCEKSKLPWEVHEQTQRIFHGAPNDSYQIADLTYELVQGLSDVPREQVPELTDRVIAATACFLKIPLITKDHELQQLEKVVTIW